MAYQADDINAGIANDADQRPLHPVRDYGIVLAGKTGSGKSATGNTILGRTAFNATPSGQSVTAVSSYATSEYGDRTITVVDTPGVHGNVRSDSVVKQQIARMAFLLREEVHCFVICMNASEVRVTRETKEFLDVVKDIGHSDFFDHCMLVYTKPETELCDISLKEYVERQKENVDMKSFLEKFGDRMVAVNNKARDQREKTRNQAAIISMVDQVIEDNENNQKPIFFTNDTFEQAKELRQQVVSVVERISCHPSLVNAVIEAVIFFANQGTIEENKFVKKVFSILCDSEQCEKNGENLVFKNDNKLTTTPVLTCKEHIKMIYEVAQPEINVFYIMLAKIYAGTVRLAFMVGIEAVIYTLGLPRLIVYHIGRLFND